MSIHGTCDPRFAEVREEFERNFAERGDVGASVCVSVEGEQVVHLWGGMADPDAGTPWQEDTLTIVMSTTKGATALCAHMLADRGLLDFDAPVASYWPEFAANGKETITVRMLLNHQAGLPALRTPVPEGRSCDWEYMAAALAAETPFWEPGTRAGYHALTFGWLVGEVIRRVSGRSPGTFFREEVAEPLGLDFWIGAPPTQHARITPLRPDPHEIVVDALTADPDPTSIFSLAFGNTGGYASPGGWNTTDAYQAEMCASGGATNARSLARMYTPLALGGAFAGVRLVDPATVARMAIVESATAKEATVGMPFACGLGFFSYGGETGFLATAFGHGGWGGSLGFADPGARVAFGYVMNQMSATERAHPLATAVYRALGYRQGKYGMWLR